MVNRKLCKCLLISSYQARPETRRTISTGFAIPLLFLIYPDKIDIKDTNMVFFIYEYTNMSGSYHEYKTE